MDAGQIILAAVGAVGGVGGAIFAWVQALYAGDSKRLAELARQDAQTARTEAAQAEEKALAQADRAAKAAERIADAQEQSVELIPVPGPEFKVVDIGGYERRLINTGSQTLSNVNLTGEGGAPIPDSGNWEASPLEIPADYPRTLRPGEYVDFIASWSVFGSVRVTLKGKWDRKGEVHSWAESWVFDSDRWIA